MQSRGPWLLAAGFEVFFSVPPSLACTDIGVGAHYRGEAVDEHAGLYFGPRAILRVGRSFRIGGGHLEPGLGAGFIYGKSESRGGDEWVWAPWLGTSLALRRSRGVGFRLEYGRHAVPVRYTSRSTQVVVHEFDRWKPVVVLLVTF